MPFEPSHFSDYWPPYIEYSDAVMGLVFDDGGRVLHANCSSIHKLQEVGGELLASDFIIKQKNTDFQSKQMALGLQGENQCFYLGCGWEVSQLDIKGQSVSIAIGANSNTFKFSANQKLTNLLEEKESLHDTYEQLAEKIPGFVFQFKRDDQGKFSFPFISSGFNKILREELGDLKKNAEPILNLIHRDDRAGFEASISKSAKKLSFWKNTFRFVCSKDKFKWVQGIGVPEQEGRSIVWRGFMYDISDKMNFEQRLRKQQAELEEIAFLQAHAFRRPVANMLSLSDMIEVHCRDLDTTDSLVDLLKRLKRSVKEADEVIAKIVTKTNNSKWLVSGRTTY